MNNVCVMKLELNPHRSLYPVTWTLLWSDLIIYLEQSNASRGLNSSPVNRHIVKYP
jgi:hypothetical protein